MKQLWIKLRTKLRVVWQHGETGRTIEMWFWQHPGTGYDKICVRSFCLTPLTVNEVNIYGGIEWDDSGVVERLKGLTTQKEREEYLAEVQAERETAELLNNRERLVDWLPAMTQEQIHELEGRVQRGERIEWPVRKFEVLRAETAPVEPYY